MPDVANEGRHLSFLEARAYAWAIAVFAIAVRSYVSLKTHSTGEDFFITLRYARDIALGRGFTYNSGQHVLGTTTPLYTLILALFLWLHLPAIFLGKLLNIVADGITCWLICKFADELRAPTAGLLAALLYAIGVTPISVSISGMETGLVTCIGMAAIVAFARSHSLSLWVLTAILFLLRIDGLVLGGLLLVAQTYQKRRFDVRGAVIAGLIVLPWLLFALFYFGSPLPSSVVAKLTVYKVTMAGSHSAILEAFQTQFDRGLFQDILTLLFGVGLGESLLKGRWQLLVPLWWMVIYYGTMLASPVPAFSWYFLPPWPLYLITAALGGCFLARAGCTYLSSNRFASARVGRFMKAGGLVLIALLGVLHLPRLIVEIQKPQQEEDEVLRPTGLWFRRHAAPNDLILLEPIGTIGYYSERPILDMIGLVTPQVLPCYHTSKPLLCMVTRFRPKWLCLRPKEADALARESSQVLGEDYRLVRIVRWQRAASPIFLIFRRQELPSSDPRRISRSD
jgi:hypothetical protein